MRKTITALCFWALFALPSTLFAQQTDPTVSAFLRSSLTSMTGTIAVSDVSLSGTADYAFGGDASQGEVQLFATSSGSSKVVFDFGSRQIQEVRTQSSVRPVGYWSENGGTKHQIPLHNLCSPNAWFFPAMPVAAMLTNTTLVTYVGKEDRDGTAVLHFRSAETSSQIIEISDPVTSHLSQIDLYLSSATFLPSEIAFNTHPDDDAGTDIAIRIRFSDYRSVNGISLPFRIQKLVNGSKQFDIHVQGAGFNTGTPVANF